MPGSNDAGGGRRLIAAALVAALAVPGLVLGAAMPAGAADLTVTSNRDAGAGTLRAALTSATANPGPDTITIRPGLGPIATFTPLRFTANGDLVIRGNGATLDSSEANGGLVFTGGRGTLTVERLTFARADVASPNAGALVLVGVAGDLLLSDCTFRDNLASPAPVPRARGAALIKRGTGTTLINRCSFTGNVSSGPGNTIIAGAILVEDGPLTVVGSDISGNIGSALGDSRVAGAISGAGGPLTLVDSSVTSNIATGLDDDIATAGVMSRTGPLTITNSTVAANELRGPVGRGAGGIYATGAEARLVYATVTDNTATGETAPGGKAANVMTEAGFAPFASVIAPAAGLPNCSVRGPVASAGHNFSDDGSCGLAAEGDRMNAGDAGLGRLTTSGRPGPVRVPSGGSPLIDAIPYDRCTVAGASGITADERGGPRPLGGGCDIGAIEAPGAPVTTTLPPATTTVPASSTTSVPRSTTTRPGPVVSTTTVNPASGKSGGSGGATALGLALALIAAAAVGGILWVRRRSSGPGGAPETGDGPSEA
ncbi:MAG: choice-of-anchor Q domain-containing protein [Actinomycetota bacterium]